MPPPAHDDFLTGLNPAQREAVTHPGGPLLVFAGAGSGKTRVLTYRIAYLISRLGVAARSILAVTFTNKAATEMKERTEKLIGSSCRAMWIGTFHACCARILRESGAAAGVPDGFVIFDDADQTALVRECLKAENVDTERYPPRAVLSQISRAKERLLTARDYAENAREYFERLCSRIYERYEDGLKTSGALDFDDLLMRTVRFLREDDQARRRYQQRFEHILVDEYQDINYAQFALVHELAGGHRNVCVVGDDDQSIYAFRGADVDLMLRFERDYPDARIVKLEQNYRSTQAILQAAHAVVAKNRTRKAKSLWTSNGTGSPVEVHEIANEQEEAVFAVQRIQEGVLHGNRRYGDYAILYRTNAQSRAFEEVFTNFGVPHRLVGARPFYQRKEVKDIIAYLRVARNPHDGASLKRIINVPARGIGATTQGYLDRAATNSRRSLWDVLCDSAALADLSPRSRSALGVFVDLIGLLHSLADHATVSKLTTEVISHSGYLEALKAQSAMENRDRIENVNELLTVTGRFDAGDEEDRSLARFLEQVALVSDLDEHDLAHNAVTLMTLHSSKGLEFHTVFLVGMEQGLFPHVRSMESDRDMEEERRLCYVGVTRAQQQLILTHAYRRTLFGMTTNNPPSRFIEEMGVGRSSSRPAPAATRLPRPQTRWNAPSPVQPMRPPAAAAPPMRPGQKVRHPTFGNGVVVSVRPSGDDHEVAVAFPARGVKRLLLSLAKLEKT